MTIWSLPLLEAMPPWPAITCSKASTLGSEVIRILAFSATSRGEAAAIPPASTSPVGDAVADDLEAVTQEVAHHRRAHDANADDADAPGHHALPNLCRRSANRDCSSSARDVIARSASRATSNPKRTSTQRICAEPRATLAVELLAERSGRVIPL